MTRPLLLVAALTAWASAPPATLAQTALPLGETVQALLAFEEDAPFTFDAPSAGFLTVVVRAEAGEDLMLTVTDDEDQVLPDGESDSDIGGDLGAEQVVVTIPRAGRYVVFVESLTMEPASFVIGGAFLASELAASVDDPDGRPSTARELAVGASHEDTIHPATGDGWDWFRIPVAEAGILTVLTRGQGDGDLRLELYRDGEFREPLDVSDQDMDGVLGNESLTVDVDAGEVIYLRVLPSFGGRELQAYRVASGLIPG